MTDKSPSIDIDLFSDAAIADPHPRWAELRDAGPIVWLQNYDMWAISRFDDVRSALRADSTLVSGQGVAMNDLVNESVRTGRTPLVSDGDQHGRLRKPLMKPMMPGALRDIRERVQGLADELLDRLLAEDSFDGITDFAHHLPVSVVSVLIGLPPEGRERMLEWAAAAFNALGPLNERAHAGLPGVMEAAQYVAGLDRADLDPDGWAAGIFQAADEGLLEHDETNGLVFAYVSPSLDTTILGAGHMLYQLGRNPEQFAKIKTNRSLIPGAVHESLRIGSPVRAFSRLANSDYESGDVFVPAGDRVLVIYQSANHDERRFADPNVFDVERDARDHVAFGFGMHRCAGAHLAQLEMECLLDAMARKVTTIEVDDPTPFPSNMLSGFASMQTTFA